MQTDTDISLRSVRADWLRAESEVAWLRIVFAADAYNRAIAHQRKFNPYHDDAGRFTTADGSVAGGAGQDGRVRVAQAGGGRVPNRSAILARYPEATPAQQARWLVSQLWAREEIAETQALIPGYRPRASLTEGVEGEIARNESAAEAARAARTRFLSEGLTGGPARVSAPLRTQELCYPAGSPVGSRKSGSKPHIRTLTDDEFATFLREATRDATEIKTPESYDGVWYRRADGDVAGVRISRHSGITIDILKSSNPSIPPRFRVHSK